MLKKILIKKEEQIFIKKNNIIYEQAFKNAENIFVDIIKKEENFINIQLFNSNLFYIKNQNFETKKKKIKYKKISKSNKLDIIEQSKNLVCITKKDYLQIKNIPTSSYYYWLNNINKKKNHEKKNINYIHEIIIIYVYRFLITYQTYLTKFDQQFLFNLITSTFFSTCKINKILNKNRLTFKKTFKRNYSQFKIVVNDLKEYYEKIFSLYSNMKKNIELLFQDETPIFNFYNSNENFTPVNTVSHFIVPDKNTRDTLSICVRYIFIFYFYKIF
jgi:hypothetical protein